MENEEKQWMSTYGVLTADRILGRFNIHLDHKDLIAAVKNPHSIYFQLVRVPLKNVYNGIILQQTADYQSYAQKQLVDYLMSGLADQPTESAGENTREELEIERNNLIELNNHFSNEETSHKKLIAKSQAEFIKDARALEKILNDTALTIKNNLSNNRSQNDIKKIIHSALINYSGTWEQTLSSDSPFWMDLSERLETKLDETTQEALIEPFNMLLKCREEIEQHQNTYLDECNEMRLTLQNYRSQFYDLILRIKALVANLPDYKLDEEKDDANIESIQFDSHLGEQ